MPQVSTVPGSENVRVHGSRNDHQGSFDDHQGRLQGTGYREQRQAGRGRLEIFRCLRNALYPTTCNLEPVTCNLPICHSSLPKEAVELGAGAVALPQETSHVLVDGPQVTLEHPSRSRSSASCMAM